MKTSHGFERWKKVTVVEQVEIHFGDVLVFINPGVSGTVIEPCPSWGDPEHVAVQIGLTEGVVIALNFNPDKIREIN